MYRKGAFLSRPPSTHWSRWLPAAPYPFFPLDNIFIESKMAPTSQDTPPETAKNWLHAKSVWIEFSGLHKKQPTFFGYACDNYAGVTKE